MHVTSLQLENFRCFKSLKPIALERINVLIGPNNAGKSSILKAFHLLQDGSGFAYADVRVGELVAQIRVGLNEIVGVEHWGTFGSGIPCIVTVKAAANADHTGGNLAVIVTNSSDNTVHGAHQLQPLEPNHFIVPFLSKRKVGGYQETVNLAHTQTIQNNFSYLAAKLSRLSNPSFPRHSRYFDSCKAILGFQVTAIPSVNGHRPGIYLPDQQTLYLDQLGEGVANVVALLADLAISDGKLFLIEEPENDLHPQALKALLDLILDSSQTNQFVISTHSNIVVRHLTSAKDSILYNVTTVPGTQPPVAEIQRVERTVEARLAVLRDLGYSFSDFDLWDGWLILEESSAERIIRDYLIPWFAPRLSRIRTLAAGGISKVAPVFEDFDRLVRFTHLEPAYKGRAWVRVDGDEPSIKVVERLRDTYKTWAPEHFGNFSKAQFELYYPDHFSAKIAETLALAERDKQAGRTAKKVLLDEVRAWLDGDESRGRAALGKSAEEVISFLQGIERLLLS